LRPTDCRVARPATRPFGWADAPSVFNFRCFPANRENNRQFAIFAARLATPGVDSLRNFKALQTSARILGRAEQRIFVARTANFLPEQRIGSPEQGIPLWIHGIAPLADALENRLFTMSAV
jgi:hypothetical protein